MKAPRILLVGDAAVADLVRAALPGVDVHSCANGADAAAAPARAAAPDLVLVAVADTAHLDLSALGVPVLALAGAGEQGVEAALVAMRQQLAARDAELAQLRRELAEEADRGRRLAERLTVVSGRETQRGDVADCVGQSPALQEVLQTVGRLQPATIPVLITGESGTGKELIARALHFGGPRAEGPFVPVNCSAIPSELAESLLFGHVRGAFTGADSDREGYFVLAHGGTLFLDEISDMPLELQAKLLRVLEDGRVQPVGAKTERQVQTRVIAATNVELQGRIRAGAFREDLYFRLARYPVRVPPLRQRREDIPLLARHFLQSFADEIRVEATDLSDEVVAMLQAYDFPGNVRELRNVIERVLIESGGGAIEARHVHLGFAPAAPVPSAPAVQTAHPAKAGAGDDMPLDFAEAELLLIQRALRQAGGNITEAARLMGINRTKIYRRLAAAEEDAEDEGTDLAR